MGTTGPLMAPSLEPAMPHTPLPWSIDKDTPSVICGPDNIRICVMRERDEEWDNAQFIVQAANNLDGLVSALTMIAETDLSAAEMSKLASDALANSRSV